MERNKLWKSFHNVIHDELDLSVPESMINTDSVQTNSRYL